MVKAQEWLDKTYPNELTKRKVEELAVSLHAIDDRYKNAFKEELEDSLVISNFVNLKKLYLYNNKLTKLVIVNCPEIELINCSGNFLTDTNFLSVLDPRKLTDLLFGE